MSRKILFVKPPSLDMGNTAKGQNIIYGTKPYGVLSIMTYINRYKTSNIDLSLLDLNIAPWTTYTDEEIEINIKSLISTSLPSVVGLSIMYNHVYPYIEKIGRIVKSINSEIIVIAGGPCVTAYYKEILYGCPSIDAICYSEGEIPVLQLLEAEDMHSILETHISFLTKNGLLAGKIPNFLFVEDLDDIPLVDFGLINLSDYVNRFTIMRVNEVLNEFCLPITTTRGCPYNCVFCTAGGLSGKKVRKASAKKIIADVKEMKVKYGLNTLSIEDDQALFDKDRAKEMLRGLADLDIALFITSGFTLSLIDDEMFGLFKQAGLQQAVLPIESGCEYVLHKIIDKPIKLEMVSYVVNGLKEQGILCHANIIIGFPGENEEHLQETLSFLKNSDIDWCYFFCATALKGSRLYEECVNSGYINIDEKNIDGYCVSHINTPDFTAEEITKKAYIMNLELNFVNNNRFSKGDYKTAILYFEHVANKYPDHALANYYLAKCYEHIPSGQDKVKLYLDKFKQIIEVSNEQRGYASHFKLV